MPGGQVRLRIVKTVKDKLEACIKVLGILMLIFAVFVGIGVTGEIFSRSLVFGRFTAVGVDGEAALGFVTFLLNYRLRTIQDTEIALLKSDVAEAQRLTEQERLARMKIEERLAPRHIAEDDRQRMIAALRPHATAGRLVDIIKCPNDAEVDALTHRLSGVLTDAGWKPTVFAPGSDEPLLGITVEVRPQSPPSVQAGTALISALAIAGLGAGGPEFSLPRRGISNPPPGTRPADALVRITIGRK
jgi:hypothetical protein